MWHCQVYPSYSENTDILDRYHLNDEDDIAAMSLAGKVTGSYVDIGRILLFIYISALEGVPSIRFGSISDESAIIWCISIPNVVLVIAKGRTLLS